MNRILTGLLTTGIVASAAIAATGAYFTDSKTSVGNTFTAGNLKLEISSQCTYNGAASNQCGLVEPSERSIGKFFNFSDVKPGDWGENTITFNVNNNPAWMCADLGVTTKEALADYLQVFWWADTNGNNLFDNGEKVLYSNTPLSLSSWLSLGQQVPNTPTNHLLMTVADASWNWVGNSVYQPVLGSTPQHLGVAWCFGTLGVNASAPGFTCDGSGENNLAQGTKVVADLKFDITQAKNQPDYRCQESINRGRQVLTPVAF